MNLPIRRICFSALLVTVASAPAAAQTVECSPVIKNSACTVTINRESPSTPQPFLMTGHAPITIVIRKRPFDKIDVNSTFTDVTPVDPLAAIIGAFAPSFASIKVSEKATIEIPRTWSLNATNAKAITKTTPDAKLLRDLGWIATQQDAAKAALVAANDGLKPATDELTKFAGRHADNWTAEGFMSASEKLLAKLVDAEKIIVPTGVVDAIDDAVGSARKAYAGLGAAVPDLSQDAIAAIGEALNGVTAQQTQLNGSAKSILGSQDSLRTARLLLEKLNASDDSRAKALLFTEVLETTPRGPARSMKAAITMSDALSKDKTDLGTITATWNSTRWEVSTGTVFSTRPITKYGVANSVITESNTRPMVVPFALAHYNLWETSAGRYRVALLASGGLGVNTDTKSADFGYGLSLSYRGVYLSALNHRARETVLSGGLVTGQAVPSSVTAAPTELKWKSRTRLGVALTLRLPF